MKKKILRKILIILGIILLLGVLYFAYKGFRPKKDTNSYLISQVISRGDVSSSLKSTGTIIAKQKLNLDVYKKEARINTVNITNGKSVKKGDLLVAFDKNDVLNKLTSAQVSVSQAKLNLAEQKTKNAQEDTRLPQLRQNLSRIQSTLDQQEQLLGRAKSGYLSQNISLKPDADMYDDLINKKHPEISGTYYGDRGVYKIEIYSSSTKTGYSFRYSGLESGVGSIYYDTKTKLGTKGLSIVFSKGVKSGDMWVISIPSTDNLDIKNAQEDYEDKKRELEQSYQQNLLEKKNIESQIAVLVSEDTDTLKNIQIKEKRVALSDSYQQLKDARKVIEERNIIAPFDGTITGMRNVIQGTTPQSDSGDPVNLGTLVSHEYLVSFFLGVADVAKVAEGQKILLKIPAYPKMKNLHGEITEISILPSQQQSNQYEVRASIDVSSLPRGIVLREGLEAEVEVISKEVKNVIRVPKKAIQYEDGQTFVKLVAASQRDLAEANENGGVLEIGQQNISANQKKVTIGLTGRHYIEVTDGLKEGDRILVTVPLSSEDEFSEEGMGAYE